MKLISIASVALTIPTLTEKEVPEVTFATAPMSRNPYCLPDSSLTPDVESLATANWFPIAMPPVIISAYSLI